MAGMTVAVPKIQGFDDDRYRRLVAEGYLRCAPHPSADFTIVNYTAKAQYERVWTPETVACRGLIIRGDGTVVARPFGKFFNADDLPELPVEPFEAFEKLDGSLGILYEGPDGPAVASRGSLDSPHAHHATALFNTFDRPVPDGVTLLFEYIAPWNRIVCDYGDREELVLLAAIDTATGRDVTLPTDWPGPVVRRFDGVADFDALRKLTREGDGTESEGFVARFASGLRVKLKRADYVRIHRLVTQVSPAAIWEAMRAGQNWGEILERVPDEFAAWVRKEVATIQARYNAIERQCRADFRDLGDRKATALYFQTCQHPGVLFKMLDRRPYAELIWKQVRPQTATAFRSDETA